MNEGYLRRLEYEIQSKGTSIRENLELRADETSRETQSATKQRSGIEATKGEVTHLLKPYVNSFSGADPVLKNESSFEEWKLEVDYLRKCKLYPESSINHAIRNSFKGQAHKVFINMDPESTNQEVIEKMESVFGNVASRDNVL